MILRLYESDVFVIQKLENQTDHDNHEFDMTQNQLSFPVIESRFAK